MTTRTAYIITAVTVCFAVAVYLNGFSHRYNVVIFAFDGLQAKHLHAYGYPLETTPNLDAFLADSYVFQNTVSPASWTVPTFMSMFTSRYPSEHRITNKLVEVTTATTTKLVPVNLERQSPEIVTLAEVMQKNGYATAAFTGDAGVTGTYGFNQGFETYYDADVFGGLATSVPKARDWLAGHKGKPFFLFVHGYDVHGQYKPKSGLDYRYVAQPYTGQYTGSTQEQRDLRERGLNDGALTMSDTDKAFWRAVYDEKINNADAEFGAFLEDLTDLGLKDNTIVIVLSDHGTEFFEHGRVDHGHTLYDELLRTLFAVHIPEQNGARIQSLVSTLDLAPTLLSVLNIEDEALSDMRGADLTPAFSGADVSHDVYSETDYRLYTHKRSLTTVDGWKFILTRETGDRELYHTAVDPEEQKNVLAQEPVRAYELEQKLLKHLKGVGDIGPWTLGCLAVYGDQCK
jgi:choline-sulfatase